MRYCLSIISLHNIYCSYCQDDEGDNAFHIAAEAAKMIRENLEWLIIMLRNPDAAIEVRNHRQVSNRGIAISCCLAYLASDSHISSLFSIMS